MEEPPFFAQYDVPQVLSECSLLRVQNARFLYSSSESVEHTTSPPRTLVGSHVVEDVAEGASSSDSAGDFTPQEIAHPRISLQRIVDATVALKSHLNVEIVDPTPIWPYDLFSTNNSIPSFLPAPDALVTNKGSHEGDDVPSHVLQAIMALQREVLLLKNELNFETWVSRENVRHIAKLYEHRVISRRAETERQALVCGCPWV